MNVTDVTKADECCCSCIHNKRTFDKDHHCTCACELDGHRIGYVANFGSVCEEWEGGEMNKYIIELDENAKEVVVISLEDGDMWTETMEVEDLEQLNSDYINEHFGELQDEAYQKGLAEDREQMPCDTCAYRHNKLLCADCKWTYGSRYKVDSIGVGDVVETKNGTIFAVTKITADGLVVGFAGDGSTRGFAHSEVTKTGRHYNINEILGGLCDD